jgi:hypothetical protein
MLGQDYSKAIKTIQEELESPEGVIESTTAVKIDLMDILNLRSKGFSVMTNDYGNKAAMERG